jgi:hypothetical protein
MPASGKRCEKIGGLFLLKKWSTFFSRGEVAKLGPTEEDLSRDGWRGEILFPRPSRFDISANLGPGHSGWMGEAAAMFLFSPTTSSRTRTNNKKVFFSTFAPRLFLV